MGYIGWAFVAMAAYGVAVVFLKVALRDLPLGLMVVIPNVILVAAGVALMVYRGESVAEHMSLSRPMLAALLAGATLSLGIVSYYTALRAGQISVVAPIFAMYFAVTTVLGIIFLGEEMSWLKAFGVALACVAVFLLAR